MRTRSKWILATWSLLGASLAAVILFVPVSACACGTPGMWFEAQFGPIDDDTTPAEIRALVLAKLAIGTPRPLVAEACDRLSPGRRRCTASADGYELVHEVTLWSSLAEVYESRLRIAFRFDRAGNLADVVPARESWFFGVAR